MVPHYHLQVRVFDNGTPPLFSDAFVTVHIIEESRYPPLVAPLEVTVNSFLDDFPGAVIGTVVATDQDPYDQLSYDLVPGSHSFSNLIGSPDSGAPFEIDGRKGTVVALQGLDVGSYLLNVSVSDGKFVSFGEAKVNVRLVSEDLLDDAVIIRSGH